MRRTFESALSIPQDYLFDVIYRTDTAVRIRQQILDTVGDHKEEARDYVPTRGRAFSKLMTKLRLPGDSVLLDYGSGKGKILLLASRLGFKRVIGVEFSPSLCDVARNNIAAFRRTVPSMADIEVICADAAEYQIQNDTNVFFMFNPFGMSVMTSVANNIKESLRKKNRSIWLIYADPVYARAVEIQLELHQEFSYAYGGHDFAVLTNRL